MRNDVARVINKCHECLSFDILKPINEKAKALPINDIFDRVGIDPGFRLPKTDTGFRVLIIFTEYLSKFPIAMPI